MGIFSRRSKQVESKVMTIDDLLLTTNDQDIAIDARVALEIPMVKTCVDLIGDKIASLPIKLYRKDKNGQVIEVKDDTRIKLLNNDNGDTISCFDMKKNIIKDMIVSGEGYIYIEKLGTKVKSLRYIENSVVTPLKNHDAIFKDVAFNVNGKQIESWEMLSLLNDSKDGATGFGIIDTNKILLQSAYYIITNQKTQAKTSNIPKGVLESAKKLGEQAIQSIKQNWRDINSKAYGESAIILNDGVTYKPISTSNQQAQVNENTKLIDNEICSVLGVPYELATGCAKEEHEKILIKSKILPIIDKIEKMLNKNLLMSKEKEQGYYFAFDLIDLMKASMKERYEAYSEGIQKGFLQINEVRAIEKLPKIEGLDGMIKLNLADVLYNPSNGNVYTPNTGATQNVKNSVKEEEVIDEAV
ncbi:phage portal protein [Clostridium sp. UBA1056]|uniref:phage portal protein n=1 Tax=unclassified Clostridium TaxID=2614128 RepID=UPI0032177648